LRRCGGKIHHQLAHLQLSGHDPVVAACYPRSLIIVRALSYADLLRDEHVVETVFDRIRRTSMYVRDYQRPRGLRFLDILVFVLVYSQEWSRKAPRSL
jgi:hypothetical protein